MDGFRRSLALCNLANILDESGRWVEAYEAYADALEEYPNNGNAAGNIAELIKRRLATGRGPGGHYAAVFNKYVDLAKRLRPHTVQIAGELTAQRWDALQPIDTHGHDEHPGDTSDPYQKWIRANRLALSEAIEGLGSDNPRWDDASPPAIRMIDGQSVPTVFAALNVLKAEFLAARALAFEGQEKLLRHIFKQDPDDTGTYTNTLDYSIYGQPAAQLILAQRAALDVLDKIAVTADLHFETRMPPSDIWFRSYWFDKGSGVLRPKLPRSHAPLPVGAAIALAELSFDVDREGLYAEALALRNAGTHRLVRVNLIEPGGVSDDSQNTIGLFELVDGCVQTLQVIRSAYLYLLDLIAEGQRAVSSDSEKRIEIPLPVQE
ncbi:LA2681 family HEPN domain-containing protein [Leifsonia xyli]|uniref:LA2681 family HEPN domain-containing protein n=1 Tax=Leifsonia xyli TaxID=1575 RepID=UPI0012FE03FC